MNTHDHTAKCHRLPLLARAWLRVLLYLHEDQAASIRVYRIPRLQDEVNRGVTALSELSHEKQLMQEHEAKARDIRARLACAK
jgi:hypothetical protein